MPGGKDGLPEVRFKRSGAAVAGTAALDGAGDEKPAGAMLGTARRSARIVVRGFHGSPAHVILRRRNFSGHSCREDTCGFQIR